MNTPILSDEHRAALAFLKALASDKSAALDKAISAWSDISPEDAGDARVVLRALADRLNEDQALSAICALVALLPNLVAEACNGLS